MPTVAADCTDSVPAMCLQGWSARDVPDRFARSSCGPQELEYQSYPAPPPSSQSGDRNTNFQPKPTGVTEQIMYHGPTYNQNKCGTDLVLSSNSNVFLWQQEAQSYPTMPPSSHCAFSDSSCLPSARNDACVGGRTMHVTKNCTSVDIKVDHVWHSANTAHSLPKAAIAHQHVAARSPAGSRWADGQRAVLRLVDALSEPQLGSPELPTVGSVGHVLGNCKPCAFMHTKGCDNGVHCPYCHICGPDEKKRRRKEKQEMRQARREVQRCVAKCTQVGRTYC